MEIRNFVILSHLCVIGISLEFTFNIYSGNFFFSFIPSFILTILLTFCLFMIKKQQESYSFSKIFS